MSNDIFSPLFTAEVCKKLLPPEQADIFFEALFGDAEEGAYDIELRYDGATEDNLRFDILLHERPGRCLACNLTQGLPQVFSRHPVINIAGIVSEVDSLLGDRATAGDWSLGYTQQQSRSLHSIPLSIKLS